MHDAYYVRFTSYELTYPPPCASIVLFKVFLVHFKEITGCDGVVICEFDIIPHSLLKFGDGVFHQVRVDGMESFSLALTGNFFFICLGFGLHIGFRHLRM